MNKLTLDELCTRIKTPRKTLILCHKNPDPDTLGSSYALKYILEHYGSRSSVACCDEMSRKLSSIFGEDSLTKNDPINYERIVCVDVASPSQLGENESLVPYVDFTIDHHASNIRFSDYYEDLVPACAEIIVDISKHLGIYNKLPKHFYECAYAGISGDTGCFKYSSCTPKTYICASDLVGKGIDFAGINHIIFDSKTMGEVRAIRATYENMKLYHGGELAIIMITSEMKRELNITNDDIGDIVNVVRQIEGVMVAISIKQSDKDESKYTVSSRSNCDINVSDICATLGGGGHAKAAGANLTASSPAEALKIVQELFEGAL